LALSSHQTTRSPRLSIGRLRWKFDLTLGITVIFTNLYETTLNKSRGGVYPRRKPPRLQLWSGITPAPTSARAKVSFSINLAFFLASGPARVKLQIDEGMWYGFDFFCFLFFRQDYQDYQVFFRLRRGPSGRRPLYPYDPVNPVQIIFL
jgi:hypothetical protein